MILKKDTPHKHNTIHNTTQTMNKYFERCVIEQTGVHSLCDTPLSAKRDGTHNDIHLLKTYYGYALTGNPSQMKLIFYQNLCPILNKT